MGCVPSQLAKAPHRYDLLDFVRPPIARKEPSDVTGAMPSVMADLDSSELSENKKLIRTWLRETLMPLAETVADRAESDGGAQAHIPTIMRDLRQAVVEELVGDDLVDEFEEDVQYTFKDRDVAERMLQSSVKDLALMSHIVRTIAGINEADPFARSATTSLNLDDFAEAKHKALIKYTENMLVKFCVNNLQTDCSDEEDIGSEDSDDEEDDNDDAAGIEKDSDDDEGGSEEGSESGEPDSDDEKKMLADAVDSDDDEPDDKKRKREEEDDGEKDYADELAEHQREEQSYAEYWEGRSDAGCESPDPPSPTPC